MGQPLRLGLYSPYFGTTLGGGEKYLAQAARALRLACPEDQVDLAGAVTPDAGYLERIDVDLRGIRLLGTAGRRTRAKTALNAVRALRPLRNRLLSRQADRFSAAYDLFLAMVYAVPIRSAARRSVMLCQFPYPDPGPEIDSFEKVICQSEFVAGWVRRYWGRDAAIVNPPVVRPETEPDWEAKAPWILSVGRFFEGGHNKRHELMVSTFRHLCDSGLAGWELHLAGSVHRQAGHAGYFERVRDLAQGYPVVLHPDCTSAELAELYRGASLYWHAAGQGVDALQHPEQLEHFGMSTAEAMGHGAVPVVFAGGGQIEVVEDGVDGRLWREPAELESLTRALAEDASLRRRLGQAGRSSSGRFAVPEFRRRLVAELQTVLDGLRPD